MHRVMVAVQNTVGRDTVLTALVGSHFDAVGTTPSGLLERYLHMVEFGVEPDAVVADLTIENGVAVRHLAHLATLGHRPVVVALVDEPGIMEDSAATRNYPRAAQPWQIVAGVRELLGLPPGESWR